MEIQHGTDGESGVPRLPPTQRRPTMPPELTLADLAEIEALAKSDAGEPFRGALLALVEEVRRLRQEGVKLEPVPEYRPEEA